MKKYRGQLAQEREDELRMPMAARSGGGGTIQRAPTMSIPTCILIEAPREVCKVT